MKSNSKMKHVTEIDTDAADVASVESFASLTDAPLVSPTSAIAIANELAEILERASKSLIADFAKTAARTLSMIEQLRSQSIVESDESLQRGVGAAAEALAIAAGSIAIEVTGLHGSATVHVPATSEPACRARMSQLATEGVAALRDYVQRQHARAAAEFDAERAAEKLLDQAKRDPSLASLVGVIERGYESNRRAGLFGDVLALRSAWSSESVLRTLTSDADVLIHAIKREVDARVPAASAA